MNTPEANWDEKRQRGFVRYLIWNGVLLNGGPFAVVMQGVGYFILRDEGQAFTEYFMSSRTWITFFLHATLFGGIMGFIKWRRNERAFTPSVSEDQK